MSVDVLAPFSIYAYCSIIYEASAVEIVRYIEICKQLKTILAGAVYPFWHLTFLSCSVSIGISR